LALVFLRRDSYFGLDAAIIHHSFFGRLHRSVVFVVAVCFQSVLRLGQL